MSDTAMQLTFDVGGSAPDKAIVRFTGDALVHRQLLKSEEVHLQLVDADGVVVADGYGRVVGVSFRDKLEDGEVVETTRVHSVKFS